MKTLNEGVRRLVTPLQYSAIALLLIGAGSTRVLAQDAHSMAHGKNTIPLSDASALVQVVRDATARFQDVAVAQAAGYALQFGCVTGESSGAMGLHYVNGPIVNSGIIDAARPQIVIYEPKAGGGLRLIGADYLVLADTWNASHSAPPELMGQLFHLFTAPNRFGLPTFYSLHVWAWKDNPNGSFTNWHPDVSCELFSQNQQVQ
jgi:hypothetical protein